MPGFWKVLKKSLADSYDYLGLILLSSAAWFIVVLGGLTVTVKLGFYRNPFPFLASLALFFVVLIAPLTAAVHHLAKKIVTRDDPSLMDLLRGFVEFLVPSWKLGFLQGLITLVILGNAWFYLTRGVLILQVLGILFIYLTFVWAFSLIYHYPLLIEQRSGPWKTVKRAFLLALDNVVFTAQVFFAIILLTCFSAVTLVGMLLIFAGTSSVLATRALRALFVRYEIFEPEREPAEDDQPWKVDTGV
jgi:hypothetical protein